MTLDTASAHGCHGGVQSFHRHRSAATGVDMAFSVFTPPGEGPHPVLWCLAGLTCTEENFPVKAGAQARAADLGLMLIGPDTSPRGEGVADDPAFDLGQGAGFYLDATEAPWSAHFRMRSWLEDELPALIAASFPGRYEPTGDHRTLHGRSWGLDLRPALAEALRLGLGVRTHLIADELPLGGEGADRLSRARPCGLASLRRLRAFG